MNVLPNINILPTLYVSPRSLQIHKNPLFEWFGEKFPIYNLFQGTLGPGFICLSELILWDTKMGRKFNASLWREIFAYFHDVAFLCRNFNEGGWSVLIKANTPTPHVIRSLKWTLDENLKRFIHHNPVIC